MLSIIVAVAKNNVIGKDNKLIWHLPEDLRRFKRLTTNHNIIMGRKTFESLPGLLPGRRNIILSRSGICPPGAEAATGVLELLELLGPEEEQAFVIGGGEIYRQLLPYTERVFVTKWDAVFDADTFFPNLDECGDFVLECQSPVQQSGGLRFTFCQYRRKQG